MKNSILSQRWPWITAVVVVIGAYLGYLSTFVEIEIGDQDRRPVGDATDISKLSERDDVNLLFILVDTLRADRLSGYGYERNTSPTFDRLAERGVRFAHHLSQSSWTKCSMASLWTGLYPARSGVTRFDHRLSQQATMPAEILREAGFQTVGLYRNGWVEGYFGFDQGFDVYTKTNGSPAPPSVRRENPTLRNSSTDLSLIPSALEFVRINGDQRWFLYVHLMDLHEYLYDEDSAKFGTAYSDIYDNSVLRVNLVIKDLLDKLRRAGHMKNTLVAIASDHGEAFSERGFEGHARKVYRETTEVPFILSFPFRLDPGLVLNTRTRNVDIWPTMLDLLGLPAMPDTDGRSRLPAILAAARGEEVRETRDETAIAHLDQHWGQRGKQPAPTVALLQNGFRYVMQPPQEDLAQQSDQLFDSNSDPAELRNVINKEPEIAQQMRAAVERYLAQVPPWGDTTEALEIDEIQLNQLRALGYKIP